MPIFTEETKLTGIRAAHLHKHWIWVSVQIYWYTIERPILLSPCAKDLTNNTIVDSNAGHLNNRPVHDMVLLLLPSGGNWNYTGWLADRLHWLLLTAALCNGWLLSAMAAAICNGCCCLLLLEALDTLEWLWKSWIYCWSSSWNVLNFKLFQ